MVCDSLPSGLQLSTLAIDEVTINISSRTLIALGIGIGIGIGAVALPLASPAAVFNLTAPVTKVMTHGSLYGGCMAALAISPTTKSTRCGESWVSFSCTGSFNPKDLALDMMDSAKLASATNKQVYVQFNDAKLHNGYCTAIRLDVIK